MRKHYLLFLIFPILTYAQDIDWERSYGGRQADYLSDVQPTPDYGFILAGSSLSQESGTKLTTAQGNLDFWVWKMDEHGVEDWQKSFGGSGSDLLHSIRLTRDGGFIIGGTSNSPSDTKGFKKDSCRGKNDFWIIKLDAKGNEIWQRTIGGAGQDDLVAVWPTIDGGYIAAGSSDSQNNGDKTDTSRGGMDYWIIKLNKEGHISWQKTYGGAYADLLRSFQPTADGGFILGGYSNSSSITNVKGIKTDKASNNFGFGGDYWVLKLNDKGDIEWQQTLGGDGDDQLFAILQTSDKGYIAGGSSWSDTTGNKSKDNGMGSDIWLVKLDKNGQMIWQQTYDFNNRDILVSLIENKDGSLLLGGYTQNSAESKDEGVNDYLALKTDGFGEEKWRKTVGSNGEDILSKVIETRDGGYLFTGTSNPESISFKKSKKSTSSNSLSVGNAESLAVLDNAQKAADKAIKETSEKINAFVDKKAKAITDKINKAIPKDERFKISGIGPTGKLLNPTSGGGNLLDGMSDELANKGRKPGLKGSRDKKINYGDRDFWVVKLKDKSKTIKDRKSIEAFPNPVHQFTNVIINFDYNKGTLAVFNISGSQVYKCGITGRTIPVDLSKYPTGVYIINISTDKGDESIKIIKE